MSKLLFFSDLHCHNYEDHSTRLPNGRNSRLQDCLNIIGQAKQICTNSEYEDQISHVYFLGDIFHARYRIDVDVLTATVDAMHDLAREVSVSMLVGNHDQYTRVGEVHSTGLFYEDSPYISLDVLDTPGSNHPTSPVQNKPNFTIAWYPHTTDIPAMKDWIKKLPPTDILLIHQGVSEAAVGPYDMHVKTEISIEDLCLDKFRHVIAGDYHKRQFIKNFHYVGSPLQLSYGERGDVKCFSLLDTDTWQIESIPTNAPRFFQFANLAEFRAEQKINYDVDFATLHVPHSEYNEALAIKAKYPRIVVTTVEEKTEARARVGSEVIGNDRALIEQWIKNNPTDMDEMEIIAEALSILQEEEV